MNGTAVPCASAPDDARRHIEVKVIGEDGVGLDGINLLLTRDGGEALTGKSGPAGFYRFKGLAPGSYRLGLPDLDKDAWQVDNTEAMPAVDATSMGAANWRSLAANTVTREQTHVVKQGDFVGKLAERYGFFSKTIWDYAANADLKKLRDDKMNILYEEDLVVIPAKREKTTSVVAGKRITVRRLGIPERLRIRFLDNDDMPRSGVPYVLSISSADCGPVADIASETDADGNLDEPIPPSATIAILTLNPGEWPESHEFHIGYKDPADTVSGWQARLNNLGYDCGAEDGIAGERTQNALRAFRKAAKIEVTGAMDSATLAALVAMALS